MKVFLLEELNSQIEQNYNIQSMASVFSLKLFSWLTRDPQCI